VSPRERAACRLLLHPRGWEGRGRFRERASGRAAPEKNPDVEVGATTSGSSRRCGGDADGQGGRGRVGARRDPPFFLSIPGLDPPIHSRYCAGRALVRTPRCEFRERSDGRPLAEQRGSDPHPGDPPGRAQAADLLRAALEKVVFFEWRVAELSAQVVHAEERAAAAMRDAAKAAEDRSIAEQRARMAESRANSAETERARMSALLAASRMEPAADRERISELETSLAEARTEISRQREERERWLSDMVAQARAGGEGPAALADFISELRGEVISLRERLRHEETDQPAGAVRSSEEPTVPIARPHATAEVLPPPDLAALPSPLPSREPSRKGSAARALSEQSLRQLSSTDPERRAQAARHLAAVPEPAAAPDLAAALARERDPRVRGALAVALVACGAEGAAGLVAELQGRSEPAVVRLAALDALCSAGPERARAALETAARDESPAIRRRAAMLALTTEGADEIAAALARDTDSSVRAATRAPPERPALNAVPPRDEGERLVGDAVAAVRAAIFGLSDEELARHLEMSEEAASALAARLVGEGLVARRGRRLVASGNAEGEN
jgi:HEAT repeat protein